jgi:DNA-binding transcriptional regulator GbsR (MarR family)
MYDKSNLTVNMKTADPLMLAVGAPGRRFVMHWGEMGWRWGVNRTVAQLHALLFLAGRPMHAEELAEILQVARSNISNSLRELQNWQLVRVVHLAGDRRDHYEAAQDPWELMRTIVRQRKAREFDPTISVLRECIADPGFGRQDPAAQKRVRETLALMESVSTWTEEMLGLESATLARLAKLGSKLQTFVRGKGRKGGLTNPAA